MIQQTRQAGRNPIAAVLAFTFRHWANHRFLVGLIVFEVGLATLAEIAIPIFAGQMIDAITAGPQQAAMAWWALAVMLGLAAVGVVCRQLFFTGITHLTTAVMSRVAQDAFARLQRFSTDWHANNFAGSTVRKITRGMWALDLLFDTLLVAILPAIFVLIGTTIILANHWPLLGLIVFVGSIGFVTMTVVLSVYYAAPAARLANRWDTSMGGALADAITCNSVVKAFGAEAREDGRLGRVLRKWRKRTSRAWLRGTWSGTAQQIFLLGLRAAVLGGVLWLWLRGEAGAGDVALVLTSYTIVHGYLRDIGQHIHNLQRSVNDMEELVAFYDEAPGVEDKPGADKIVVADGAIAFEHVTFHYRGHATPLYRDFSMTIKAGERVGLVGHSGSGKTTFVKLIQRLYDLNDGRITIDGQDIAAVTQTSLRASIAIVQQEPILFHRSLAENIGYGRPQASQAEIERAAQLANAHDFIVSLPKGYATMVGERGIKLSGGERQRVALARAFLADAPILILDEATASLDSESEYLIQEAMERLMAGRTTIVIAHRLSTVRAMDRILVFERGRIIEEGDHATLLRQPDGVYRGLFELQAAGLEEGPVA
ncbi:MULTISPECIES: ABC transporter ATP-binding protein [unclassified Beijerinckia]|uniref:ABC transporter ATP-binding protein n=1 Tax=unclassified Beijerinckia TaxID=2638183 RepID=UPI0008995E09|nr:MULTISPECIES: ABC transporter ATP-binding protein [unclassified Beijerinckia]MDH7795786.1 ATP-binding cassette subfamily B protein [Beijerinckia sp. GAS462]SEC16299.1 ATP-binding cassette, subfamily B [Beijerinckia sp. 28-YEA-48]